MTLHALPAVNATLNAIAAVLLVIAYILILNRRIDAHRRVMIAAFTTSSLFLVCYIVYHAQVGSVRFTRQGFVPPLAIITLSRGLKARFDRHRAIARWTLPIWLYVSVTGVLVYVLLYQPTWLI